jgi:hypothetical protein
VIRRRDLLQLSLAALGGSLLGSASLRVLGGESPTRSPSRALFDAPTRALVAELAEMIIPATDTPGAMGAGVPAFLEMMVADWYTDTERKIFLEGLAALDAHASTTFGKPFMACSAEQRVEALRHAEQLATTYVSPVPGGVFGAMSKLVDENTPFFTKLKELTVLGYFSSEVGAKQELAYNPMPMRFDGDYDYAAIGRQWSY